MCNNELKGKLRWGCCCCCSVSVSTRCWLWLKGEVLFLNTAVPLHREHYPLSNQRSHALKPTHYFLSYPNFLIRVRLRGGFLASCATEAEPKPLLCIQLVTPRLHTMLALFVSSVCHVRSIFRTRKKENSSFGGVFQASLK